MKSISIPQERPLDQTLIRILESLDQACRALGIPYLLTGAMAREILLVHGYGLPPGRATRDVDFGFQMANWATFEALKASLFATGGFQPDLKIPQASHPWTGSCRACAWAERVIGSPIQEWDDSADYVSQLAAAFFAESIQVWLNSSSKRIKPALFWRCPWCRIKNRRLFRRDLLKGATQASSLVPPCEPEVVLESAGGPQIAIAFGFPRDPARPWQILPLQNAPGPRLRATPDPKHPHRLALNGTNRPTGFPCMRCGRDCLGSLPSPWIPMPWCESQDYPQSR